MLPKKVDETGDNISIMDTDFKKSDLSNLLAVIKKEQNSFDYVPQKLQSIISKGDKGEKFGMEEINFVKEAYKSNFADMVPPLEKIKDDNWIIAIILVIVLIGMFLRAIVPEETDYPLYISGTFNYLALLTTCLMMRSHIFNKLLNWIEHGFIFDYDKKRFTLYAEKQDRNWLIRLIVFFAVLAIIEIFVLYRKLSFKAKIIDALGMLAFGLAVSNDHMEALIIQHFEKKLKEMGYNERKDF